MITAANLPSARALSGARIQPSTKDVARYSAGQPIPCGSDLIDTEHMWLYLCEDDGGAPMKVREGLQVHTGQALLTQLHPACRIGFSGQAGWSVLRLPKTLLTQVAAPSPFSWEPLLLDAERTAQLVGLVQDSTCPDLRPIALFLCECAQHDDHGAIGVVKQPNVRDSARLKRLVEYVQSRLGAPLSLEDFARASGMSVRGVHLLCKHHYKLSPMELLRTLRLEAVRERLVAQPDQQIGEIALLYGFGHLGRFSQYYKTRFGELPTETRAQILARQS